MKEKKYLEALQPKLDELNYQKLSAIANLKVHQFIFAAAELCNPQKIFVCSDSLEDISYVRQQVISIGEEKPLAVSGHTYHFDGPEDQGRDREVTKFLVPKGDSLSPSLNQINRDEGLREIKGLLEDAMKDRTMIVRFLTLGPADSIFTILCMECTDSWYVAHSVDLLYRPGYRAFLRRGEDKEIFCTLHSAGRMNENMVSIDYQKKRIYIDYLDNIVYSVNTQYAGNSVGFKKLALRLAMRRAHQEGWLAEHFMIIGVNGPGGRRTYLSGAFPSACGKTSTAMLPGETILADDLSYLRNIDGICRAVNVEAGIFGIIQDVNPTGDPAIYKVLITPGEVIFSNVLVKDGKPYWLGMGCELLKEGVNFSGVWFEGKTDKEGNKIPPAHKNARYTAALRALENVDQELNNPLGVELAGIMYGGRDPRGYVPVQQGFNWEHGIIAYGASLETETTYAILGKEGIPEINLMSIQDFVSIPLGKYILNNLEFGRKLKKPPLVFGVNYFLRDKQGKFLNGVQDKHVWVKWMELRVHNEVGAISSPTGWLPKYEDLYRLFRQVLNKNYAKEDYNAQFTVRIPENLAKIERVEKFYRESVADTPEILFEILTRQRERLLKAQKQFGDYILPESLAEKEVGNICHEPLKLTRFSDIELFKRGKVRDVYDLKDKLLIVSTDRISCFDVVLPTCIPYKGEVLTKLSLFWFEFTKDIVPNHLITAKVNDYPQELSKYKDILKGRSMLVEKAKPIPVECVVRGYLSGSGWKEYKESQSICGIKLPSGLKESDKLPQAIFTPATKEEVGHDINVPQDYIEKELGREITEQLKEISLALYKKASQYAESKGIIIADTKFEFGLYPVRNASSDVSKISNGVYQSKIILIDEVLTPDSSRFWPKDQYQPGISQPSFDKQFVRDYLQDLDWNKTPPAPELPPDIILKTSEKYLQALKMLTEETL